VQHLDLQTKLFDSMEEVTNCELRFITYAIFNFYGRESLRKDSSRKGVSAFTYKPLRNVIQ